MGGIAVCCQEGPTSEGPGLVHDSIHHRINRKIEDVKAYVEGEKALQHLDAEMRFGSKCTY
jgi:hypothetical protein